MNRFVVCLMVAASLFFTGNQEPTGPVHVVSRAAHIDITTKKVVHIVGEITQESTDKALLERHLTETLPGPRIVIIDSPGGSVMAGNQLIKALIEEKKTSRQKLICIAIDNAHSMAFNTLTICDVRLATSGTHMVVHNAAIGSITFRGTAKNLRRIADMIDRIDSPYAIKNAKAMHLTKAEYDKYADNETNWTAEILFLRGYLDGIGTATQQ